jgi:5-methylcytosine-specific restriction endonuclease McrA
LRDREKCQAELQDGTKCGETKWLHQHHIIPKEFGGKDTAENLITLCSSHHRMVHAEIDRAECERMAH